jgi:hypothetical protein
MNYLSEITVGANFSFTGNGSTSCTLPTPSSDYIEGANGKWYNTATNIGYTPANVPNNTAATYTAIASVETFAIYSSTDASLRFYKRDGKPAVGDTFNGLVVTEIYEGFEEEFRSVT